MGISHFSNRFDSIDENSQIDEYDSFVIKNKKKGWFKSFAEDFRQEKGFWKKFRFICKRVVYPVLEIAATIVVVVPRS